MSIDLPDGLGLSGLTTDGSGDLWSVPETDRRLVRLAASGEPIDTVPLFGISDDLDVESITYLAPGRFAVGTESMDVGRPSDRILWVETDGERASVTGEIQAPYGAWAMAGGENEGVEGLCHADGLILAAAEMAGEDDGRRFAPVGRYDMAAERWTAFRLWLTSSTGKISALSCRTRGARIQVLAIERHFGVSRLLEFDVPRDGPGGDVEPEMVMDLAAEIEGDPNLEGVTWTLDGRVVLVLDSQWGDERSPNGLVVLPASIP